MKFQSFQSQTRRYLPVALVLLIGVTLSALVFEIKREAVSERQRAIFSELAHEHARAFHRELNAHLDALQSLRDFMLASPQTDRASFASFARGSLKRAPALKSLQWVPAVPAEQRAAMEEFAEQDDFFLFALAEDGTRVPVESQEWHYPVVYAVPQKEDTSVVGFDYGSAPARHEAIQRAADSGSLVVSETVPFVENSSTDQGVLLLLPVFSPDGGERMAGFVSAALNIEVICRQVLASETPIHVSLLDETDASPGTSLFSSGSLTRTDPEARLEAPFSIGGRKWNLTVSADNASLTPGAKFETWSLLGGGLAFTGFIAIWVRQRQSYVHSVEKQVNERTTALARINTDLQNEMAQRRQAEADLLQSEARFREAFLHAPVGIALLSPEGKWIQVNQALVEMTGFSEEELSERTMADLLHPDEVQEELAKMGQMLAGEVQTFALEQRFLHKSGHFIWVLMNVSQVRDEDQRLLYFICQILDITDRKLALEETRREKQFSENIIKSSIDGILAFDLDGKLTVWNSGMEEMTGIPASEALEQAATEIFPFLAEAGVERAFKRVLAGGTVRAAEHPFSIPSSGRRGFFAGHYAPLHDMEGGITGGVAVLRDVTAQREARERLQTSSELLKRRNRELQDFAYVASHDLQEPLRKIRAFGNRLEEKCEGVLTDQAKDYLRRMQDAARRMQTLINDLLSFSRISTEAHPFAPVDLNTLATEVLSDLEEAIEETGAQIEVSHLPTVEADATQLRQLLQNLIGNGLKYHRLDAAPHIRIYAREHAAEDNLPPLEGAGCLLHVTDNGIGFDEKYLDRIFTVFQRLHGRSEYPGTGVGLAICRKIVERHNGWITANSVPGEGSTFIAALPYKQNNKT